MPMKLRDRFLTYLEQVDTIKLPDRGTPVGLVLARLYLYKIGLKFFKDRVDAAETEFLDMFDMNTVKLHEGSNLIIETKSFAYIWEVSKKRKTFSPSVLADTLFKTYRIPREETMKMIEDAKVPGTSAITKRVVAR